MLLRTVLIAGILFVAGAGCSGDRSVSLPDSPAPTAPQASPSEKGTGRPPTLSPKKEEIASAYEHYFQASYEASRAPVGQMRTILAPYAEGKYLDAQVSNLRKHRKANRELWGVPGVNILKIKISGSRAVLWDCQGADKAGLANRDTHKLIPGTRGGARAHVMADMKQGNDGRWRLTALAHLEDEPCSPEQSS